MTEINSVRDLKFTFLFQLSNMFNKWRWHQQGNVREAKLRPLSKAWCTPWTDWWTCASHCWRRVTMLLSWENVQQTLWITSLASYDWDLEEKKIAEKSNIKKSIPILMLDEDVRDSGVDHGHACYKYQYGVTDAAVKTLHSSWARAKFIWWK